MYSKASKLITLATNLRDVENVVKLLCKVSHKSLRSNYYLKLAFIDRFAHEGWELSTNAALSNNALFEFLEISNILKVELEVYYAEIFSRLFQFSEENLSQSQRNSIRKFIGANDVRICWLLSFVKVGSSATNEYWFTLISEVFREKKRSKKAARRFVSYVITHYHLSEKNYSPLDKKSIDEAVTLKLLDLSDVGLLSQALNENDLLEVAEKFSAELIESKSDNINYSLVLANLQRKKSEKWKLLLNDFLCYFGDDHPQIHSLSRCDFFSLAFEPIRPVKSRGVVSIGMPAYNSEKTIEVSLFSLLNQSYHDLEVIVVDDNSSDRTCEIVEAIAARDPRVRLIRKAENTGPYVSRNIALNVSKGRFFTINDSDDISLPNRIESHVDLLIDNDAFAVESKMLRVSDDLTFISDMGGVFIRRNPSSLLFEKSIMIEEFGYWNSVKFGADTELYERLITAGKTIINSPKPYMLANFSEKSLSASKDNVMRGPSGDRKIYSKNFRDFHAKSESFEHLRYGFADNIPFLVPNSMKVEKAELSKLIDELQLNVL